MLTPRNLIANTLLAAYRVLTNVLWYSTVARVFVQPAEARNTVESSTGIAARPPMCPRSYLNTPFMMNMLTAENESLVPIALCVEPERAKPLNKIPGANYKIFYDEEAIRLKADSCFVSTSASFSSPK